MKYHKKKYHKKKNTKKKSTKKKKNHHPAGLWESLVSVTLQSQVPEAEAS